MNGLNDQGCFGWARTEIVMGHGFIYWVVHELCKHVATAMLSPLKYLRGMCSGAISPREIKYIQEQWLAQGHFFFSFFYLFSPHWFPLITVIFHTRLPFTAAAHDSLFLRRVDFLFFIKEWPINSNSTDLFFWEKTHLLLKINISICRNVYYFYFLFPVVNSASFSIIRLCLATENKTA